MDTGDVARIKNSFIWVKSFIIERRRHEVLHSSNQGTVVPSLAKKFFVTLRKRVGPHLGIFSRKCGW